MVESWVNTASISSLQRPGSVDPIDVPLASHRTEKMDDATDCGRENQSSGNRDGSTVADCVRAESPRGEVCRHTAHKIIMQAGSRCWEHVSYRSGGWAIVEINSRF